MNRKGFKVERQRGEKKSLIKKERCNDDDDGATFDDYHQN